MVAKKKTTIDLALATFSQLLQKAAGYVVIVLLSRHLAKEDVGAFFFANALAMTVANLTELGATRWTMREVAVAPERAGRVLGQLLMVRVPALLVTGAGLLVFAAVAKPAIFTVIAISCAYVFCESLHYTANSVLMGLRDVKGSTIAAGFGKGLLVLLVALTLISGGDLLSVLVAYTFANAAMLLATLAVVRRHTGAIDFGASFAELRAMVVQCLPFATLAVLALIHLKADTLMLGLMLPGEAALLAVATYEAAYKILEVSRFFVRPASSVYYPVAAQLAAEGRWAEFVPLFRRLMLVCFAAGAVMAAGVIVAAPWIIRLAYGEGYEGSVVVLRVLFLATPMLFAEFLATYFAHSVRAEGRAIAVTAAAVVANVTLNAIAIPRFGPVGAAWATVVTETLLCVLLVGTVAQRARRLATTPRTGGAADESPLALASQRVEPA